MEFHNRNKKGITVDLKSPQAKEIVRRLTEKSDVFLTNFRPRAAARVGMNYTTLSEYNPRLIYASATAFGHKGPDSDLPGIDPNTQARAGVMTACGEPGWPPVFLSLGVADEITGVFLAYGVIAALYAREKFGIVQEVTTSQLMANMHLLHYAMAPFCIMGKELPRQERARARNPLTNWYKCQDGRWICLGMFQPDRYWEDFCEVTGLSELVEDPRFEDNEKRAENCEELVAIFDRVFATKTYDEWEAILKPGGKFLFSRINTISDLPSDPQVTANDMFIDYDHPDLGPVKFLGQAVNFSKTPGAFRFPAPALGEHNEEILSRVCGDSPQEIAGFKDEGVI